MNFRAIDPSASEAGHVYSRGQLLIARERSLQTWANADMTIGFLRSEPYCGQHQLRVSGSSKILVSCEVFLAYLFSMTIIRCDHDIALGLAPVFSCCIQISSNKSMVHDIFYFIMHIGTRTWKLIFFFMEIQNQKKKMMPFSSSRHIAHGSFMCIWLVY